MPDISSDHPPAFEEPRLQSRFQPVHYPLCNGMSAPPPATPDRHERRCLEFLAAYYAVNTAQAEVLAGIDSQEKLRLAMLNLEMLEDRYASVGFFGEPVMRGVFYADIHFARPGLPRSPVAGGTRSSHLAIPGLEALPLSEITGTPVITRWTYGEADS